MGHEGRMQRQQIIAPEMVQPSFLKAAAQSLSVLGQSGEYGGKLRRAR